MREMLKKLVSEMLGTFAIVFFGCGIVMISERFPGTVVGASIPLVFGLVVAAMVYALGHISGAHFNPAVTLAFAYARHFPRKEILPYWTAQFMGGILAMGVLYILLPEGKVYGETVPSVTMFQALGWEIVQTFTLMLVVISVATDTRAVGILAGLAVGATVAVCAFVAGPVTGASMNPARSLAPALFGHAHGNPDILVQQWIYFLGPVVGALLAVFCYEWMRRPVEMVKGDEERTENRKERGHQGEAQMGTTAGTSVVTPVEVEVRIQ